MTLEEGYNLCMNTDNVVLKGVTMRNCGSPIETCVINVGGFAGDVENDEHLGWVGWDTCFLKGPSDVVRRVWDESIAFYSDHMEDEDIFLNGEALLTFALYELPDGDMVFAAEDSDMSVFADGMFEYEGNMLQRLGIPLGDGVSAAEVCHADDERCVERCPEFFTEEVLKVLFGGGESQVLECE